MTVAELKELCEYLEDEGKGDYQIGMVGEESRAVYGSGFYDGREYKINGKWLLLGECGN